MELVDMNSLGLFDFLILSVQVGFTLKLFFLICCGLIGKSWIFGIHYWVFESLQHKRVNKTKGGYNSIGRMTVCGTVSSLFEPGYPPS